MSFFLVQLLLEGYAQCLCDLTLNVSSYFQELIGLKESFIRSDKMLSFKVYCPGFQAIPNNLKVTAKRMLLPSNWVRMYKGYKQL